MTKPREFSNLMIARARGKESDLTRVLRRELESERVFADSCDEHIKILRDTISAMERQLKAATVVPKYA